jgi:putative MFS transporter
MVLTLSAQYGFLAWVPTLLLKNGASFVHSLNYAALMALGAPLGMIVSLSVIDRVGRRPILAGTALAAGTIGIFYSYSLDGPPGAIIAFGFLEVMFLQVCASTIFGAYLPELFPTDVRGLGTGASIAVGRVAAALMPYLVLLVLGVLGAQAVFVMLAAILFVLAVVVFLVGPETKMKTLEAVDAEHAGESVGLDAAIPFGTPNGVAQHPAR